MERTDFENILDDCCARLTAEARAKGFTDSAGFEYRVREVLDKLMSADETFRMDYNPHPQAFPDIALGEYGVEVKFARQDTWRCIANSVLETQRIESVKHIYIVYGKMDGKPEVRWGGHSYHSVASPLVHPSCAG